VQVRRGKFDAASVKSMLVVLGVLATAWAVDRPALADVVDQIFARLDSNGDGVIDRTEFQIKKMELFYESDANQNIQLEPEETNLKPEVFAAADTNGDGVLSGVEFIEAPFIQFEAADTNSDHVITREEFELFAEQFLDR
jgi:Ca2+-binding EF-hand superfamily protein